MSAAVVEFPVGLLQREMTTITTSPSTEVLSTPIPCSALGPRPSSGVIGPGGPMSFAINASPLSQRKCKDFTSSNKVKTIVAKDLAVKLDSCKDQKLLLLDCRPFIAYNLNHINGALNISCCDRFTKRKLERGKATVGDLVSGHENAKNIFKEYLKGSDVVLYDENTSDIAELPANNPLSLVLSNLIKDGHQVLILKGGLKQFQDHYSELCAKNATEEIGPLFSPTTPLMCSDIATATASKILPYLYLGNERDAHNLERLRELGVTDVLNVTSHIPLHFENDGINYKRLPASDSCHQKLSHFFDVAFEFIEGVRKRGGKVLVHCQAGVSRSATIVCAYIMKHSVLSMLEAYKYIKTQRSIVAPNFNFMGQLLDLENQINAGSIERCLEHQLVLNA